MNSPPTAIMTTLPKVTLPKPELATNCWKNAHMAHAPMVTSVSPSSTDWPAVTWTLETVPSVAA